MLVNLTPDLIEIERRKQVALEYDFDYIPQSDQSLILENGIYLNGNGFNFPVDEFVEELHGNYNELFYMQNKKDGDTMLSFYFGSDTEHQYIHTYGVADNIKQIKRYYKKQIKDTNNKFVISVTPVYQDKNNRGKCDGWRWHKWGVYIGKLKPKCEYLDDEDFGDDFKCVYCFEMHYVVDKK